MTDKLPNTGNCKFRYRQNDICCKIEDVNGTVTVRYDKTKAVTPGQICVIYSGEECLGGGIIKEVRKEHKNFGTYFNCQFIKNK